MLRFPPNINLQIAHVIADDTDFYQLMVLYFFYQIVGNQSDFSIDHWVMSMCKVVSCVVEKGC